ncbi:MAG: hypothetical protein KJZ59_13005 [Pararhodobacter sp.]|nr:hypothetical protein [Pararhodobacter sp.]
MGLLGWVALARHGRGWHAPQPEAPPVPVAVSTLALILAVNLVDLLPNATLIPMTWLIAGALLGYAETLHVTTEEARRARMRHSHSGVVMGLETPAPTRSPRRKAPRTLL